MKFTENELGQPVVYVVLDTTLDGSSHTPRNEFIAVEQTLDAAERIATLPGLKTFEQDMQTGTLTLVKLIKGNLELKHELVALYKSGYKRESFEKLDLRKPFGIQLNFPLIPELEKIELNQNTEAHD